MKTKIYNKKFLLRPAGLALAVALGLSGTPFTGFVSQSAWAHGGGGNGGESSSTTPAPTTRKGNPHRDIRVAAAALVQAVRTMREAQEALDLIKSNPGGAAELFEDLDQFNSVIAQLHTEIRTARAQAHGAIEALTVFLSRVGFTDPQSRLKGAKLSRAHTRAAAARDYSVIGNLVDEAKKGLAKIK